MLLPPHPLVASLVELATGPGSASPWSWSRSTSAGSKSTAPKMPRRPRRPPTAAWPAAPDAADMGQRPTNARDTWIPMPAKPPAHHPLPPGHRTGSVLRHVLDGHPTWLRAWRSVPQPATTSVDQGRLARGPRDALWPGGCPTQARSQLLATTSTVERALPSSAVQLRGWSRPTTTTRLPFDRDCAACSAWSRHTTTVKTTPPAPAGPRRPPGTWPGRCRPRCAAARGRR
jgi:hypothetical protein